MPKRPPPPPASRPAEPWSRSGRPESFSTYVPRELVRRVKLIAALRDVPLWTLVTEALATYVEGFEGRYGTLPTLPATEDADSSR